MMETGNLTIDLEVRTVGMYRLQTVSIVLRLMQRLPGSWWIRPTIAVLNVVLRGVGVDTRHASQRRARRAWTRARGLVRLHRVAT